MRVTGWLLMACALGMGACLDFKETPLDSSASVDADTSSETAASEVLECVSDADCDGLDLGPCQRGDCVLGQCQVIPDDAATGNACSVGDARCDVGTCNASGTCENIQPLDCSSLDSACQSGVCDPGTGTCQASPVTDDTPCTGELCVIATCQAGSCTPQGFDEGADCATGNDCLANGTCSGQGACLETWICPCEDSTQCDDGLACTADTCEDGSCTFVPYPSTCAINGQCYFAQETSTSACQVCIPNRSASSWSALDCDDGNPCTEDVCSPADGCVNASASLDFQPCDDGLDCNGKEDICNNGTCGVECTIECTTSSDCYKDETLALAPCQRFACSDNTCTLVPDPLEAGEPCSSGDPCLVDGVCDDAGTCQESPVDCGGDACIQATCLSDGDGYTCETTPVAEGTLCDDGDACTFEDTCGEAGKCGGTPVDCSAYDTLCAAGVCTNGSCTTSALPNDSACDDGNNCTTATTCVDGVCAGQPTCSCSVAGDCPPDGLACTFDVCYSGNCAYEPETGFCVIDGQCYAAGEARQGNACMVCDPLSSNLQWTLLDCNDGNACTTDTCTAANGCVHVNDDQAPCDDGDDCTTDDACQAGTCVGTCECFADEDCSAPPPACSRFACIANSCIPVPDATKNGETCDDGEFCTAGDVCQGGMCVSAGPTDCSSVVSAACEVGECDEGTQACVAVPASDGVACDDNDNCTLADTCSGGTCSGQPQDCSNLDGPCTEGVCNAGACSPAPTVGVPCDDGETCTEGDICSQAGTCVGAWNPDLPDCGCASDAECTSLDDACNDGVCNVATFTCVQQPKAALTACDDGDPCTVGDTCSPGGNCLGNPYVCDDGLACTLDTCNGEGDCNVQVLQDFCVISNSCRSQGETNPANPCQTCNAANTPDDWSVAVGVACDDGDACTNADACVAGGGCAGTAYSCPDDGLPCTVESCGAGVDECLTDIVPGSCAIDGACYFAGAPSPATPCQACAPSQSTTSFSNVTGACDDGEPCTFPDLCSSGACEGTPYVCDDGKSCTTDSCDGQGGCVVTQVPNTCLIGGTCVDDGDASPTGLCQICDASVSTSAWSPNSGGTPCDDGLACTDVDVCDGVGNCLGIGNTCVADWCEDADCGNNCAVSLKPGHCKIGGECFLDGDRNPANTCQQCAANSSTNSWSAAVGSCEDGDPCSIGDVCLLGGCQSGPFLNCNDNLSCTLDLCNPVGGCLNGIETGSCLIGGQCYSDGDQNPANECQVCNPSVSATSWSARLGACAGPTCTSNICSAGTCVQEVLLGGGQCYIGGTCLDDGAANPENPCQACDSSASATSWTAVSEGTSCGTSSACSSSACNAGTCVTSNSPDYTICGTSEHAYDWCFGGTCNQAAVARTTTHNESLLPDRYEGAALRPDGGLYATYFEPESCNGVECQGVVKAELFVAGSQSSVTGTVPGPAVPLPAANHSVDSLYLSVETKILELQPPNFVAFPEIAQGSLQALHSDYVVTPQAGAKGADHLFWVDNGIITSCANTGAWNCTQDSEGMPVGSAGGFFPSSGGIAFMDTGVGNTSVRFLEPIDGTGGTMGWTVKDFVPFNGAQARDVTASDSAAIVVGTKGLIGCATLGGPLTMSVISVPGLSEQSLTTFQAAATANNLFVVAGNATVTSGSTARVIHIAYAPSNQNACQSGTWRSTELLRVNALSCGQDCWVNDNEVRGVVWSQNSAWFFGASRANLAEQAARTWWRFTP